MPGSPSSPRASTRREVDTSALTAFAPVLALAPLWVLAVALIWWPVQLVWAVPFVWFAAGLLLAGVILFWRPAQRLVLTRLLGARTPHPAERGRLVPAWKAVAQANHLPPERYVLAIIDDDEVNAFACGGHLVVVSSYAVAALEPDELRGVLAHELSHHLGSHTIALTIAQWLSLPILVLARVGFFFQNVAQAAAETLARNSASLEALGRVVAFVLNAVAWVFLAGLLAANVIGNVVGRSAEFQADRRAVEMGYGPELARALRRVLASGAGGRPRSTSERLFASHPPARTRVARIEALLRARR
jgi:Zn-dependent protease with chaperone function